MPAGCCDHRRQFLQHAAIEATALAVTRRAFADSGLARRTSASPIDAFWCCIGLDADASARRGDSIHSVFKSEPRPAPGVAAGRSGAAARLRTLSARQPRFEAHTHDDAIAMAPPDEIRGERNAVH